MREIVRRVLVGAGTDKMGTLQNYINHEEVEERAKDNKRVDLRYIGPLSHLKGKKGTGYFIANENHNKQTGQYAGQWYFRPNGSDDEYRVSVENLDFER